MKKTYHILFMLMMLFVSMTASAQNDSVKTVYSLADAPANAAFNLVIRNGYKLQVLKSNYSGSYLWDGQTGFLAPSFRDSIPGVKDSILVTSGTIKFGYIDQWGIGYYSLKTLGENSGTSVTLADTTDLIAPVLRQGAELSDSTDNYRFVKVHGTVKAKRGYGYELHADDSTVVNIGTSFATYPSVQPYKDMTGYYTGVYFKKSLNSLPVDSFFTPDPEVKKVSTLAEAQKITTEPFEIVVNPAHPIQVLYINSYSKAFLWDGENGYEAYGLTSSVAPELKDSVLIKGGTIHVRYFDRWGIGSYEQSADSVSNLVIADTTAVIAPIEKQLSEITDSIDNLKLLKVHGTITKKSTGYGYDFVSGDTTIGLGTQFASVADVTPFEGKTGTLTAMLYRKLLNPYDKTGFFTEDAPAVKTVHSLAEAKKQTGKFNLDITDGYKIQVLKDNTVGTWLWDGKDGYMTNQLSAGIAGLRDSTIISGGTLNFNSVDEYGLGVYTLMVTGGESIVLEQPDTLIAPLKTTAAALNDSLAYAYVEVPGHVVSSGFFCNLQSDDTTLSLGTEFVYAQYYRQYAGKYGYMRGIYMNYDNQGYKLHALDANTCFTEDATLGIDGVSVNPTASDNRIYTISGQYVGTTVSILAPGLYISNGRKFVVK